MSEITIGIAVLAGVVSFLSPCVFPLVPAYVSFITGASLDELTGAEATGRGGAAGTGGRGGAARVSGSAVAAGTEAGDDAPRARPAVLPYALLFVAGFSLVFILMGGSAGYVGGLLLDWSRTFEVVGGVFMILFGLLLIGLMQRSWAGREWRLSLGSRPAGAAGSLVAGVTFGFAWTPCIGPILGGILTLAATGEAPGRGMVLLTAYSAGLAIPFLLAAVGLSRFLALRGRIGPWLPRIQKASGVILILLGILLITGDFTRLAEWLNRFTPAWVLERI